VSARKIILIAGVIFSVLTVMACVGWLIIFMVVARDTQEAATPVPTYHMTSPSGRTYTLAVATSANDQAHGLGGVDALPTDRGMAFVYTGDEQRCFWMKDMHFPIDIIWLDHAKTVTHIETNVSPSTYPQQFCNTGMYVVELNTGEAARAGLTAGQAVTF